MKLQDLKEQSLRHEVNRLDTLNNEQSLALAVMGTALAAADHRVHQLEEQRRFLFWLVVVLAVMLVIAVSTGR